MLLSLTQVSFTERVRNPVSVTLLMAVQHVSGPRCHFLPAAVEQDPWIMRRDDEEVQRGVLQPERSLQGHWSTCRVQEVYAV